MSVVPVSVPGVRVKGPLTPERAQILSPEALAFVASLVRAHRARIEALLASRRARHIRFSAGERPTFLDETRSVREGTWRCAPVPADLRDRRVEITGPTDRKMMVQALNSGARVFMADLEDASAPTWANCIDGQVNLRDAVRRTLSHAVPETGKTYALGDHLAVLVVRPRGFHLVEAHLEVDGAPVPAMLFDFGFYFFHNARTLWERGSGPYFYLPKMESHHEAALWNDVFVKAQRELGLPSGVVRATCLIETLPAAFEMEEILHALRDHAAGLNCGRWDYIFSFIKTCAEDPARILPYRAQFTMTQPFLRAYTRRVIQVCHRRGVHAIGGMAAQIPIKGDEAANARAFDKVRADKRREVEDGHDGTWVAHPALVPVAREIFDAQMVGEHQIDSGKQFALRTTEADLLCPPEGTRTEEGLRHDVRVGIQYIEAWLGGRGAVPLYGLMEDAATAEISRAQIWQWVRHAASLDETTTLPPHTCVSASLVARIIDEEMAALGRTLGPARLASGHFARARAIFERVATEVPLAEFLTAPAYEALCAIEAADAPSAPRPTSSLSASRTDHTPPSTVPHRGDLP